jgi:hypothetical protein
VQVTIKKQNPHLTTKLIQISDLNRAVFRDEKVGLEVKVKQVLIAHSEAVSLHVELKDLLFARANTDSGTIEQLGTQVPSG